MGYIAEIMSLPQPRIPGPEHPILLDPNPARVLVVVGGSIIADTRHALTLREASYSPRQDVDMKLLERTDHATHCPYKGDCSYFSIPIGGKRSINAAWSYESPFEAVAAIRSYLAFYSDRVDAIEERPAP